MNTIINPSDIITCESYKGLCDYVYKIGDEPKGGLVHCNLEEIPAFFEAIKGRPDKYILVSSCSDFGLCYQQRNPVWADYAKWMNMMASPDIGYSEVVLGNRCNKDKCKLSDRYSVKCYAYTAYTFNDIPSNIVRWYMTNPSILTREDGRIFPIPFGVAAKAEERIVSAIERNRNTQRVHRMYVNWVNYTYDRMLYKEYYRYLDQAVVIDDAKPYEEYLDDLAKYTVVLSPHGNGIDCYRTLEAIYMGATPVSTFSALTQLELPVAYTHSLFGLRTLEIERGFKGLRNSDWPQTKLSHWKETFENARALL